MAEDRMLSDEILLGLIKKNSGGGGGTTNYNLLSNKPQINSVELSGNKSLSDLGIASASALANKVDKVEGKGLSTNDYTNDDKTIVSGVIAALADKVDKVEGKGLSTNDFTDEYKTAISDNTTAINEHEGDIDSLKSGLTNVNVALSVPEGTGKNLLAIPDGEHPLSGITYTVNNTAIQVVGTATVNSYYTFYSWNKLKNTFLASYAGQKLKISNTSDDVRLTLAYRKDSSSTASEYNVFNGEAELTLPSDTTYEIYLAFRVLSGVSVNTVIYPMIRLASVSDATYAPYIPSVESRIEAVESGKANIYIFNLAANATAYIGHNNCTALLYTDRGGMWVDGFAGRDFSEIKESSIITATREDTYNIKLQSFVAYSTVVVVISEGAIEFGSSPFNYT